MTRADGLEWVLPLKKYQVAASSLSYLARLAKYRVFHRAAAMHSIAVVRDDMSSLIRTAGSGQQHHGTVQAELYEIIDIWLLIMRLDTGLVTDMPHVLVLVRQLLSCSNSQLAFRDAHLIHGH